MWKERDKDSGLTIVFGRNAKIAYLEPPFELNSIDLLGPESKYREKEEKLRGTRHD